MTDDSATCQLLGVAVDRLSRDRAAARVDALLDDPSPRALHYVNAHSLNVAAEREDYRAALNRAALVLNDGVGLSLAGRLRGCPFPDNLNGSDFSPLVLERAAERGLGVALFGGRPGVGAEAARRLEERVPALRIVAAIDGFAHDPGEVPELVRASGADVLLVALGNPAQELWIDRHLEATGVRLASGVGAFLDFTAEHVRRAPAWMNRWGVEWLFRLWLEPGRMWRRYVVGNPRFLLRVAGEALATQRT